MKTLEETQQDLASGQPPSPADFANLQGVLENEDAGWEAHRYASDTLRQAKERQQESEDRYR